MNMKEIKSIKNLDKDKQICWGVCLAFIILFIILLVFVLNTDTSYQDEPGSEFKQRDACYMSQTFLNKELKSPATAKYQNCHYAKLEYLGNNIYGVYSYVDSQNSFGAMIRTDYYAELRDNGDETWSLINIVTS